MTFGHCCQRQGFIRFGFTVFYGRHTNLDAVFAVFRHGGGEFAVAVRGDGRPGGAAIGADFNRRTGIGAEGRRAAFQGQADFGIGCRFVHGNVEYQRLAFFGARTADALHFRIRCGVVIVDGRRYFADSTQFDAA